jgi:hypothetical protein
MYTVAHLAHTAYVILSQHIGIPPILYMVTGLRLVCF